MRDYVLTRLALAVGAVLGAAVLLFLLLDILPGAGGSDRPAWARFFGLFVGDTGTPNTFGERLAVTLPLALLALLVAGAVGVGLGLAAGRYRGMVDRLARVFSAALALVPPFWLGMLLALLFAGVLKLLPASGFVPWSNPFGAFASLLLPAFALGLPYAGQLVLRIRRDLADISEDDVQRLRADGIAARKAIWQLGLARALPQLPQALARTFGSLLIGAALVESVFFLPGLGRQLLGAAEQHDLVLLRGGLQVLITVAALGMLFLSLLRVPVDPALRAELRR
ncbi:MAG TPA: ABC transporter permease [Devosia sp.]|jgi:peptide/nickel transport system permease protein|uniref:ABC transporter permease n=1 Tax=Devosia sp. TaxID=1871048 RepID=UPI002DDD101A|nr:ABC transporter permease [Devosia sp.]HEV2518954.1 ABC transporter permease [Devosia sp.]